MKNIQEKGRPEPGKQYRLTGGSNEPAISNGNTWAESEVGGEADVTAKIKARIEKFVAVVQALQEPEGHINYVKITYTIGPKYARIVEERDGGGRSVHCFINLANGDVLKPKGWAGPELKNPRSNIFAEDVGASGVTKYGTVYLR